MYVIAFGQVGPAGDGFTGEDGNHKAATSVPFTAISPAVGEQFKFRSLPNGAGVPAPLLVPGTYLVMGTMKSGRLDNGAPWRTVTGHALSMSLADGEKTINQILKTLSAVSAIK